MPTHITQQRGLRLQAGIARVGTRTLAPSIARADRRCAGVKSAQGGAHRQRRWLAGRGCPAGVTKLGSARGEKA
eukprot:13966911-Alexandrium_andersonii.AAC.1